MRRFSLVIAALLLILSTPGLATKPGPGGPGHGFRMFATSRFTYKVNRAQCDIAPTGELCQVDANGGGGGIWPRGTANQYIFNSGLQVAGKVGPEGGVWSGDLAGGVFFSSVSSPSSELVTLIYQTDDPEDRAEIEGGSSNSGLAARVPLGDASEGLYNPVLRGRALASQGDAWWLAWEGNPSFRAMRPPPQHPLGILVEHRALSWNYPSGNEDIVYFLFTIYNVTSLRAADYLAIRPGMRELLIQKAQDFHLLNNAQLPAGSVLPDSGYTIENMYVDFSADMDVGFFGDDYASVNVPFALGYTYSSAFDQPVGWSFDPQIFQAPFFPGSGFAGVKYLKSPEVNGQEVGLTLFTTFTYSISGALQDPLDIAQLYRYQRGLLDPSKGDGNCNTGLPTTTRICYINNVGPADMRFMQASGPLTLAPGELATIAVAYIFAPPVATASCGLSCHVSPGDPRVFLDPASATNANVADSMAGYRGYAGDLDGDQTVDQNEILTVPGSLLAKALVAQTVFDSRFLLPFAPEPPEFFVIPGDNEVTVMWRPSNSETSPDPFFQLASQAITNGVPNLLYDPNYRALDVEGYRVYRGRADVPGALRLLAQFDYTGTLLQDHGGQVNPAADCAPELAITAGCPITFDPIIPGVARTAHVDIPLVGPIVQVRLGGRIALASGDALTTKADTAVSGVENRVCAPSSCPELRDTGVPFVFVDRTVRNNFRYYYSVTAFDVNSYQSGPGSLESVRKTRAVTPVRPASNYQNEATLETALFGRGVRQVDTVLPVLDPVTGTFSKPMPAAGSWGLGLTAFVRQLIPGSGSVRARLDSLALGNAYDDAATRYYVTVITATDSFAVVAPVTQDQFGTTHSFRLSFEALRADQRLASRYGGSDQFTISATLQIDLAGNYYTSAFGRGCVNGAPGFRTNQSECDYNGARWFDGPSPQQSETFAHPNACSSQNATGTNAVTCYTNAGQLTGVVNIYEAKSYQTTQNVYRSIEGMLGGAVRGADYNVYWGSAGQVDSVIDLSNNLVVPFSTTIGAGWGFLNASATTAFGPGINYDERAELTVSDFSCVPPLSTSPAAQAQLPCPGAVYQLSNTAVPGPIAFFSGALSVNRTAPVAPNPGFAMYMPGHLFLFELSGSLPGAGTVWSLRDYVGAIRGGGQNCTQCQAGNDGPYAFFPLPGAVAAPGAELRFSYDVINRVNAPTDQDLSQVHTVPDPYYVTSEFEQTTDLKQLKFVNLPQDAIIRIYSSSGVLLRLLEHHSQTFGGEETWDLRNRNNQVVASGVYFYHVEAGNARRVGRFTVVNWAN